LLLSAVACYRSIYLARGAISSKPTARGCCCRLMGQTEGQTDGQHVPLLGGQRQQVAAVLTAKSRIAAATYRKTLAHAG